MGHLLFPFALVLAGTSLTVEIKPLAHRTVRHAPRRDRRGPGVNQSRAGFMSYNLVRRMPCLPSAQRPAGSGDPNTAAITITIP